MKPATFYLWHEEQTGQLRLSVARCLPESLPFRCAVVPTDAANEIIDGYLASNRIDCLIPCSEVQQIGDDVPAANKDQP